MRRTLARTFILKFVVGINHAFNKIRGGEQAETDEYKKP